MLTLYTLTGLAFGLLTGLRCIRNDRTPGEYAETALASACAMVFWPLVLAAMIVREIFEWEQ